MLQQQRVAQRRAARPKKGPPPGFARGAPAGGRARPRAFTLWSRFPQ
jgi:hypothetical protein